MPYQTLEERKRQRRRLKYQVARLMRLYDSQLDGMPADLVADTPDNRRLLGLEPLPMVYPTTQEQLRAAMVRLIDQYIDETDFSTTEYIDAKTGKMTSPKDEQAIVQDFRVLRQVLILPDAAWQDPAQPNTSYKIRDSWVNFLSTPAVIKRTPTQIENRINGLKKIDMFQSMSLYTQAIDESKDPTLSDPKTYADLRNDIAAAIAQEINDQTAAAGAPLAPDQIEQIRANVSGNILQGFAENAAYPVIVGEEYGYVTHNDGSHTAKNPIPESESEKLHYLTLSVLSKVENKAVATMTTVDKVQHDSDGKPVLDKDGYPVTVTKFNVHTYGPSNEPRMTTSRMFELLMTGADAQGIPFKTQLANQNFVVEMKLDEKNRPFLRFRYKDPVTGNVIPLVASPELSQAHVNHLKKERDAIMNRLLQTRFVQLFPSAKFVYQAERDAAQLVVDAADALMKRRTGVIDGILNDAFNFLGDENQTAADKVELSRDLLNGYLNNDALQEMQDALKNLIQQKDNYQPTGVAVDINDLIDTLRIQIDQFKRDRDRVQEWAQVYDEALALELHWADVQRIAHDMDAIEKGPLTLNLLRNNGASIVALRELQNIHLLISDSPIQKNENAQYRDDVLADIEALISHHLGILSKKIDRQVVKQVDDYFEELKEELELDRIDLLAMNAAIGAGQGDLDKWHNAIEELADALDEQFVQDSDGLASLNATKAKIEELSTRLEDQHQANAELAQLNDIRARFHAILDEKDAIAPPVNPLNQQQHMIVRDHVVRLQALVDEIDQMPDELANDENADLANLLKPQISELIRDSNAFILIMHDYNKTDVEKPMFMRMAAALEYEKEEEQRSGSHDYEEFNEYVHAPALDLLLENTLDAVAKVVQDGENTPLVDALIDADYVSRVSRGFMRGEDKVFSIPQRSNLRLAFRQLNEVQLKALAAFMDPSDKNLLAFARVRAAYDAKVQLLKPIADAAAKRAQDFNKHQPDAQKLDVNAEIQMAIDEVPLQDIMQAEQDAMMAVDESNIPADTQAQANIAAAHAFVQIGVGARYFKEYADARTAFRSIQEEPVTLSRQILRDGTHLDTKVRVFDVGDSAVAKDSSVMTVVAADGAHVVDASTDFKPMFVTLNQRLYGQSRRTMTQVQQDMKLNGGKLAAAASEGLLALRELTGRFDKADTQLSEELDQEIAQTYGSALKFMQEAAKMKVTTLYKDGATVKAKLPGSDHKVEDLTTPVSLVVRQTKAQIKNMEEQAIEFKKFAAEAKSSFIARHPELFKGNWSSGFKMSEQDRHQKILSLMSDPDPSISAEAKQVIDLITAADNFSKVPKAEEVMLGEYGHSYEAVVQDILTTPNDELHIRFADPVGQTELEGLKDVMSIAQIRELAPLFRMTGIPRDADGKDMVMDAAALQNIAPFTYRIKIDNFQKDISHLKGKGVNFIVKQIDKVQRGILVSLLAAELLLEYNNALAVAKLADPSITATPAQLSQDLPGFIHLVEQLDDAVLNEMKQNVLAKVYDDDAQPAMDTLAQKFAATDTADAVFAQVFAHESKAEVNADYPKMGSIVDVLVIRAGMKGSVAAAPVTRQAQIGSPSSKIKGTQIAFTGIADIVAQKQRYLDRLLKVLEPSAGNKAQVEQALVRYIELNFSELAVINSVLGQALNDVEAAFDNKNTQRRFGGESQSVRDDRYHEAMRKWRDVIADVELANPKVVKLEDSVKKLIQSKVGVYAKESIPLDNLNALLSMISQSIRLIASQVSHVKDQKEPLGLMVRNTLMGISSQHPSTFAFTDEVGETDRITFAEMLRDPAYIRTTLTILEQLLQTMRTQNNSKAIDAIGKTFFSVLADLALANEIAVLRGQPGNGFTLDAVSDAYKALGFSDSGAKGLFAMQINTNPDVVKLRADKEVQDLNTRYQKYVEAGDKNTHRKNIRDGLDLIQYFANFVMTDPARDAELDNVKGKTEVRFNEFYTEYLTELGENYQIVDVNDGRKLPTAQLAAYYEAMDPVNIEEIDAEINTIQVVAQDIAGLLKNPKIIDPLRKDLQEKNNELAVTAINLQAQRDIMRAMQTAGKDPEKRFQALSQLLPALKAMYAPVSAHPLSQEADILGWIGTQLKLDPAKVSDVVLKRELGVIFGIPVDNRVGNLAIEDFVTKVMGKPATKVVLVQLITAHYVAKSDVEGLLGRLQRTMRGDAFVGVKSFEQLIVNKIADDKASASFVASASSSSSSSASASASSSSSSSSLSAAAAAAGAPPSPTLSTASRSSTRSSMSSVADIDNDVLGKESLINHMVYILGLEIPRKAGRLLNPNEDAAVKVKAKKDLTPAEAQEIRDYVNAIWSSPDADSIKLALNKHHIAYGKRSFFDSKEKQKAESEALVELRRKIGEYEVDNSDDNAAPKLGQYWKDLLEDRADDLDARSIDKSQRATRQPLPRPVDVIHAQTVSRRADDAAADKQKTETALINSLTPERTLVAMRLVYQVLVNHRNEPALVRTSGDSKDVNAALLQVAALKLDPDINEPSNQQFINSFDKDKVHVAASLLKKLHGRIAPTLNKADTDKYVAIVKLAMTDTDEATQQFVEFMNDKPGARSAMLIMLNTYALIAIANANNGHYDRCSPDDLANMLVEQLFTLDPPGTPLLVLLSKDPAIALQAKDKMGALIKTLLGDRIENLLTTDDDVLVAHGFNPDHFKKPDGTKWTKDEVYQKPTANELVANFMSAVHKVEAVGTNMALTPAEKQELRQFFLAMSLDRNNPAVQALIGALADKATVSVAGLHALLVAANAAVPADKKLSDAMLARVQNAEKNANKPPVITNVSVLLANATAEKLKEGLRRLLGDAVYDGQKAEFDNFADLLAGIVPRINNPQNNGAIPLLVNHILNGTRIDGLSVLIDEVLNDHPLEFPGFAGVYNLGMTAINGADPIYNPVSASSSSAVRARAGSVADSVRGAQAQQQDAGRAPASSFSFGSMFDGFSLFSRTRRSDSSATGSTPNSSAVASSSPASGSGSPSSKTTVQQTMKESVLINLKGELGEKINALRIAVRDLDNICVGTPWDWSSISTKPGVEAAAAKIIAVQEQCKNILQLIEPHKKDAELNPLYNQLTELQESIGKDGNVSVPVLSSPGSKGKGKQSFEPVKVADLAKANERPHDTLVAVDVRVAAAKNKAQTLHFDYKPPTNSGGGTSVKI